MKTIIDSTLYYLVIHGREDNAIFAFLGTAPTEEYKGGPEAIPVILELLPPQQRFGGAGGIAMGPAILGRWPGSVDRFRQFLTMSELDQAGWVLVKRYRICDSWQDYIAPWSTTAEDQSTACGLKERTESRDL
jgi:hypothetical protein